MTPTGARRLACAMTGADPDAGEVDGPLDELERSAVGEAMNQMMAAAAAATSSVLGIEVEISPPRTKHLGVPRDADGLYEPAPHAATIAFSVLGEPCRLVQLVPNAIVVRMARALDDRGAELQGSGNGDATYEPVMLTPATMVDVEVDVWVELGGRGCRPVSWSGHRPGASSPSTGWRRTPSTSTSAGCRSGPGGWSSWTAASGRSGSRPSTGSTAKNHKEKDPDGQGARRR